jgi:hypothetical protein
LFQTGVEIRLMFNSGKRRQERIAALESQVNDKSQDASEDSGNQPSPDELPLSSPSDTSTFYPTEFVSDANGNSAPSEIFAETSGSLEDFILPGFRVDIDFSTLLGDESGAIQELSSEDPNSVLFGAESCDFSSSSSSSSQMIPFSPQSYSPFSPQRDAFADDATMEIPVLKVLKAGLQIAKMLGCEQSMWDPTSSRVLAPIIAGNIPTWLQPTEAQQRIMHHPLLDILPWPSVRTKLICMFAQPVEMRPASAQDPLAVMNMVVDIDDDAEGCRVEGEDGLVGDNWEIGQAFFRNWWWALDRSIIEQSNRVRAARGAARLQYVSDSG